MLRWLRNLIEDFRFPRPGFTVQIGRRMHEGRILTLGQLRELTASGAFGAIDAIARYGKGDVPGVEAQAEQLEKVIQLAAAGLRRSPSWVARHCTAAEAGAVVTALMKASSPAPKAEGPSDPPA